MTFNFEVKKKKSTEIKEEANKSFKIKRFEGILKLKFLAIKKASELAYLKAFEEELNKKEDLLVKDIIKQIEEKISKKLANHKKLKHWRSISNKAIHEQYKVDKYIAEKSKAFFDELFSSLTKVIVNYNGFI
ncbi:MAG: hypothetical protein ACFFAN_13750 [Promethearchaeota archaeon]